MKTILSLTASLTAVMFLAGCQSTPPGVERGPHGTIAYDVYVDASAPGARIEADGNLVGNTPLHLKIYGDRDGTFHDFGSYQYVIRALPLATNQFAQVRTFGTGRHFAPEDRIPSQIYFDMNQPMPPEPPQPPVVYGYPPPPYYYGPGYYGPGPYYGPGVRVYVGPRWHRRW